MDAGTVFATVSLTMLVNGIVLGLILRDLPAELRPSAIYWLIGTLLIALGCTAFAFGESLPRPVMLTAANGFFVFGLTAYLRSVQEFHGVRPKPMALAPAVIATACVLIFSSVYQNFGIRLVVVSLGWAWLMVGCVRLLIIGAREDKSLSRKMLAALFIILFIYSVVRVVVYLSQNPAADFAVETGANWLNLLSPIVMTLLPIVGTTTFVLMCGDYLRRKLERTASTDFLTGLPNRRALVDYGSEMFVRARGGIAELAVAVLDIDYFKTVNDTYGHGAGDLALIHVARLLRAETRKNDVVARSGGEEFVVLMGGLDERETIATIERLRLAVEETDFDPKAEGITITLSAGVASYRTGDASFDDILKRADNALYRAKTLGRNRVELWHAAASPLERQTLH